MRCSPQFWFPPLKILLVATLVSTVVAAGWVTAWIFRMHSAARGPSHKPPNQTVYYPCKNSRQMASRSNR